MAELGKTVKILIMKSLSQFFNSGNGVSISRSVLRSVGRSVCGIMKIFVSDLNVCCSLSSLINDLNLIPVVAAGKEFMLIRIE